MEGLYHSGDEQKVEGVTDISGQHQRDVPQGEPGVGYSCEEHQAGEVSEPEDRSFGCCCDFAPLSGRSLGCGVIARTSDGHGQAGPGRSRQVQAGPGRSRSRQVQAGPGRSRQVQAGPGPGRSRRSQSVREKSEKSQGKI